MYGRGRGRCKGTSGSSFTLTKRPKSKLTSWDISVCSVMCSGKSCLESFSNFDSELTHPLDVYVDNIDSAKSTVWSESGLQRRLRYPLSHLPVIPRSLAISLCGDTKFHVWSLRGATSSKPLWIEILTDALTLGSPAALALLTGVALVATLAQLNTPLPLTARWQTTTSLTTTTFGVDKLRGTSTSVELAQLVLPISILHLFMFV